MLLPNLLLASSAGELHRLTRCPDCVFSCTLRIPA